MKTIIRILVAAVVLFILSSAFHPGWLEAVYALLVASMLSWVAARSQAQRVSLLITLAGLFYIPQILINIPEGVLFDVIEIGQAPLVMAQGLVTALIMAATVTLLFTRPGETDVITGGDFARVLTVPGFLWRFAAAVALFIVCYGVAGSLIYPLVKGYYDLRTMPEPLAIASMQVLRASALCALAILVVRIIPRARDARILLAVTFPVLGCIALMIPDNDLMPPMIRLVHTIEIVPYYALYGFLLAVWFGPRKQQSAVAQS